MSEFQTRRLDEFIAEGTVLLGRGDVISKEDIEEHPGPYPIYSSSAHNNGKFGEYGKFIFDEELITWSVDGGGSFFYRAKHKYSVTNVCGYMRLKEEKLHAKFIYYALVYQHLYLTFDYTSKAHPSVIKKLYWLPTIAKKYQAKIAKILTGIDTAIDKTEALIAKYQQIKTGLVHDLFTRGITPDGKLRPPREQAPKLYQETPIGWIPKEWLVVRMVDLAEDRKGSTTIGPFGSDLVATDYRLHGVPVVFVRDVRESGFEWNSETYVSENKALKLSAHSVKAGEILSAKMGLPPCISCLYPEWMPNGVITADMIRLSPDKKKVDGYWLTTAINHDRVKRQVAAITAGVTRPKVTLKDFRGIRIAKPGLDEQMLVSKMLRAAQHKIDAELSIIEKLQCKKNGLMHDLLTGQVRVKRDTHKTEVSS